jgi:hypothetical protein
VSESVREGKREEEREGGREEERDSSSTIGKGIMRNKE